MIHWFTDAKRFLIFLVVALVLYPVADFLNGFFTGPDDDDADPPDQA